MSMHEDKAFPVGRGQIDVGDLKSQLARLKEDLGRFVARSPTGSVVAPLRQRIHEIEMQIAEVDRDRLRSRPAAPATDEDVPGSRFPSRRR